MKKRLKRILSAILAMLVVTTAVPFSELGLPDLFSTIVDALEIVDSGNCGEKATWVLYDDGTLKICGSGRMADYTTLQGSCSPWARYGDEILHIIIDGVSYIGKNSFYDCNKAKAINIKNTVNHQITNKKYSKRKDHNNLNIFPIRLQRGKKTIVRIRILRWNTIVSFNLLGHGFKYLLGHFIRMSKLNSQRCYRMLELASRFCILFGTEKGVDPFCGTTVCKA